MFSSEDAPFTSGQKLALLLATLLCPPLLLGWALATLWFRETYPQRARGFAWVGLTFLQGVLLVVVVGVAASLLLGR